MVVRLGAEQCPDRRRQILAHAEDAQTVAVDEFEMRELRASSRHSFQTPNSSRRTLVSWKILSARPDSFGRQLVEILRDRLVGVQSVDMQKIHLAVGEIRQRISECRSQQGGEPPVMTIVETSKKR